jgi:4-aminobutyrate aminotransferase-like enzyme
LTIESVGLVWQSLRRLQEQARKFEQVRGLGTEHGTECRETLKLGARGHSEAPGAKGMSGGSV